MFGYVARWVEWLIVALVSPRPVFREVIEPMQHSVSFPTEPFASEELFGERVRLCVDVHLGNGHYLRRGECFIVSDILPGTPRTRRFLLTNHRARRVPVIGSFCELLLCWPAKKEGQRDGKS